MQHSAAPMQYQHCNDDQNFTIHAAPSLARGVIEHQRRVCLHRCRSSRAPTMMKISPSLQRIAPRLQLPNNNAGACCLDTAAPDSNVEAICLPSPAQRGEGGQRPDEGRSSHRADVSGLAAYRQKGIDGLRQHTQKQKCWRSERFRQRIEALMRRSMQLGPRGRPKSNPGK